MIIGPFWCEQEKSWLRFVAENDGKFSAELAKKDDKDDTKALNWMPEKTKDFWYINYEWGNPESFTEGLRLINSILYRTDFTKNKYNNAHLIAISYNKAGQKIPVRGNVNPFAQTEPVKIANITPYNQLPKLPLTDEEAQKIATHWEQWKTEEHRRRFNPDTINTFFNSAQNEALYVELERELIEFSPQKYASFTEYKSALKHAISNISDPIHAKIQHFAARTSFDDRVDLTSDNLIANRAEVYRQKQLFAYAVLKAEREALLKEFNEEVTPIENVPLKEITARTATSQPHRPVNQPIVPEAGDDPFTVEERAFQEEVELQRVLLATAVAPQQPGRTNSILPPVAETKLIKKAVHDAVHKYQSWYRQDKNAENLRGSTGWFTWFRHGSAGQKRAAALKTLMNQHDLSESKAVEAVNAELNQSSFNRHSLASFLLDELIALKLKPWHGLSVDKTSGLYDPEDVWVFINTASRPQL